MIDMVVYTLVGILVINVNLLLGILIWSHIKSKINSSSATEVEAANLKKMAVDFGFFLVMASSAATVWIIGFIETMVGQ